MEFYNASRFSVKLLKRPSRFMYFRLANASEVWFLWFHISWRRVWLPQAAYQKGWDAAWRQFYMIDGVSREKVMQDIRNGLMRDAQLRIGADDAGHSEACPADRHVYYTAFLSYLFCPYCGERLLS